MIHIPLQTYPLHSLEQKKMMRKKRKEELQQTTNMTTPSIRFVCKRFNCIIIVYTHSAHGFKFVKNEQ